MEPLLPALQLTLVTAVESVGGVQPVDEVTVPLILRLSIWKVPAVLLALKPYTRNLSVDGAVTENVVAHVPVVVVPQLALFGDWLLPWSIHVVPPLVLYA